MIIVKDLNDGIDNLFSVEHPGILKFINCLQGQHNSTEVKIDQRVKLVIQICQEIKIRTNASVGLKE